MQRPSETPTTTTTGSSASSPALDEVTLAPARGRDPWLDNTRLIAAVLIVVMHVCGPAMSRSGALYELWFASWPLRVPLFVLVAGFFSSAEPLRGRRAVAILRNVLGVYLVCDLLATLVAWFMGGTLSYTPANPPFGLWFLLSLFWWRSALPLIAHLRYLGLVVVLASVAAGFVSVFTTTFSAGRTLAYFPLFILGWYLRRVDVRAIFDRAWVRPAAWGVLVVVCGAGALWGSEISRRDYSMRLPHPGGGYLEQLPYAGVRVLLLAVGVAGALAMLAVVPRRRIPVMTYLGTGSMYIYVIHAMLIATLTFRRDDWMLRFDTVPEMLGLMAASTVFALLLATPPVRWLTRWLIQPRYRWFFRDEVPVTPPLGSSRSLSASR